MVANLCQLFVSLSNSYFIIITVIILIIVPVMTTINVDHYCHRHHLSVHNGPQCQLLEVLEMVTLMDEYPLSKKPES